MEKKKQELTTAYGRPVENDNNSVTVNGYGTMNDTYMVEKMAHFTRERIPERVVHAKGSGAYGYFEVTNDITKYTKASFLNKIGKKTKLFARFSTVGGEKGSADAERDPRGFAVKFYTDAGNYDMVGNNTPVFFIRDAIKFPDFVHTQKRHPQTGLKDPDMFWDFLSLTPESIHQVSVLFSDRGTPTDFRHMHGFSSHTYMFYNEKGEHYWFKWHFVADLGFKTMTAAEAKQKAANDPDHAVRDLFNAIKEGNFPSWTVYVQIMTPEQAKTYEFDPFDVTKVWFKKDYPLIKVGKMVLNENPANNFGEVEQAAFSPSTLVSGIYPSPDKLLQGRLFAYEDAHRYRLGKNHDMIPVNSAKGTTAYTNQRDGYMNTDGNFGSASNYYPNSIDGAELSSENDVPMLALENAKIGRVKVEINDIDFFQAGELYRRVLDKDAKANLVSNIVGHLGGARQCLQYRQTSLFYKCDAEYGAKIAEGLKLDIEKVKKLAAMSQDDRVKATK